MVRVDTQHYLSTEYHLPTYLDRLSVALTRPLSPRSKGRFTVTDCGR